MTPNYHEIVHLSPVELNKRTKAALDEFILALKTGNQINEKGHLYQALEDERLKRQDIARRKYVHSSG